MLGLKSELQPPASEPKVSRRINLEKCKCIIPSDNAWLIYLYQRSEEERYWKGEAGGIPIIVAKRADLRGGIPPRIIDIASSISSRGCF